VISSSLVSLLHLQLYSVAHSQSPSSSLSLSFVYALCCSYCEDSSLSGLDYRQAALLDEWVLVLLCGDLRCEMMAPRVESGSRREESKSRREERFMEALEIFFRPCFLVSISFYNN